MRDYRPKRDYLLLVDASSFIHRGYHALPRLTRQNDGLQTGALYGLANSFLKLFRLNWTAIERLPKYGAVILDVRGPNWRHQIDPDYKAQRKPYEADLLAQLPHIPTIASAFNLPSIGVAGFEADDIIATYVELADAAGIDVVVATSDKDLSQLVGDYEGVSCILYDAMKDKGREDCAHALVGDEIVYAKMGIWPNQVADFLALTGDAVDNVPGCPGIGPVKAAKLLEQFGTLPALLEAAEWDEAAFKSQKERQAIVDNQRSILMSRQLVALTTDVPVPASIDELEIVPPDSYALRGMLMDYEFMSLVDKVDRPPRS